MRPSFLGLSGLYSYDYDLSRSLICQAIVDYYDQYYIITFLSQLPLDTERGPANEFSMVPVNKYSSKCLRAYEADEVILMMDKFLSGEDIALNLHTEDWS